MNKFLPIIALIIGGCRYPHSSIKIQPSALNHIDKSVVTVDSSILRVIKPYSDSISGFMNTVVGFSEKELTNKRPEGLLGNFITDALLEYVKLTMLPKEPLCVVMNGGGLRAPIPKGEITRGRIFETLPFENTMVVLKITNSQMDSVVKRILSKKGEPISNLLISQKKDSIHWELKNYKQATPYIYVITSDYLANGNDGYNIFKKSIERIETGFNLRDIVLLQMQQYQERNTNIEPILERRVTIE